jgi:hypothetical protein
MPANPATMSSAHLVIRLQEVLRLTQSELGSLLGASRRSIIRWQRGGTTFTLRQATDVARACYPVDRELAAVVAARAGSSLVELGIEAPPQPPAPPAPEPAPATPAGPATPVRPTPAVRHLVDSVVCAAAEAMLSTPQSMRPALLAAFERAEALGISMADAVAGMRPPPAPAPAPSGDAPAEPTAQRAARHT